MVRTLTKVAESPSNYLKTERNNNYNKGLFELKEKMKIKVTELKTRSPTKQ